MGKWAACLPASVHGSGSFQFNFLVAKLKKKEMCMPDMHGSDKSFFFFKLHVAKLVCEHGRGIFGSRLLIAPMWMPKLVLSIFWDGKSFVNFRDRFLKVKSSHLYIDWECVCFGCKREIDQESQSLLYPCPCGMVLLTWVQGHLKCVHDRRVQELCLITLSGTSNNIGFE